MKWNDFLVICKEKLTIKEEELLKLFNDEVEKLKILGVKEDKLEESAVARVYAYLKKQLSIPAEKYTGIIFAATKITDFGAQKAYDAAIAAYKENPDNAIANGLVDEEGIPIYSHPDWKRGQKIDLSSKNRSFIMIAKGVNDTDFIKCTLNLRNDRIDKNKPIFFKLVEFRANKSNKSTPDNLILNDSVVTEFNVLKDLDTTEAIGYIAKYYGDKVCKLSNLEQNFEDNAEDQNRMVIVKGTISRVTITKEEAVSNIIDLVDMDMGFDVEGKISPPLTCWVPKKDIPIDFNEGALDTIVIGKLNKGKIDGKLSIEAQGLFVDEMFKLKEKPKQIKEEVIEVVESEEKW